MDYFPIFTQLRGRHCLVVGAGEVASRKLDLLQQAGATVTVVAPQIGASALKMVQDNDKITFIQRSYRSEDLNNQHLVIAATNNSEVNRQVSEDAKQRNIFVNVVDSPELCSFITPAIIDRAPLTIAISSAGQAPVLARLIRGKLESWIPTQYGKLAKLAEKYRDKVKQKLANTTARKNFWENVFEGDVAEKVFQGKQREAEFRFEHLLEQQANNDELVKGEVYLVGAGPGDPDLLTFRALRLMQKADVVFYDRLVSADILNLVRRDAERIYVGKQKANHCVPQSEINDWLIKYAKQGKRVLRLKGGDPYIFGRGGEEAQQLVKADVAFQVVPGITSAAGASSYCGIPLTHRDHAQSVTFATGHLKNNTVDLNWRALAQSNNTLVIYMGLTGLKQISKNLIAHGLKSTTPVAVIQNATRENQKEVIGDLSNIVSEVNKAQIESPALIVIGDVVKLYHELNVDELVPFAAAGGF